MKKKIVFIIFLCLSFSIKAQIYMPSASQQMIETAIADCFSIIEQSYQLEDTVTHQRFGRYGDEDFGKASVLAIKVGKGYLFDSSVLMPWLSDDNYKRYQNSHKPVLSKSQKIELSDSIITQFEILPDTTFNGVKDYVLVADSTTILGGFRTKAYTKPMDGWIAWISCDSTMNDYKPSQKVALIIHKKRIEFSKDSTSYNVDIPKTDKNIWGGIYIVPEQTAIGQLTFNLGGIIKFNSIKDEWVLVPVAFNVQNVVASEPVNELTPLETTAKENDKDKKSKKKKKAKNNE